MQYSKTELWSFQPEGGGGGAGGGGEGHVEIDPGYSPYLLGGQKFVD